MVFFEPVLLSSRSLYAVFEKEVWVKYLPAFRFVPPSEVFANLTINPANAGFCVPEGNCLGSGLLNVSPCKQGKQKCVCLCVCGWKGAAPTMVPTGTRDRKWIIRAHKSDLYLYVGKSHMQWELVKGFQH